MNESAARYHFHLTFIEMVEIVNNHKHNLKKKPNRVKRKP